ncbi:MAG: hypothetical protein J6Q73_02145, partial [Bacteroidaceae bacterium]|nr:hypothetical protein [Bacteroidaceae bacterium]
AEGKVWNVMCRDFEFKVSGGKPTGIETSSFAVIQPIDRALQSSSLYGYDGMVRRYAATGEPVDTMTVKGVTTPYLIANAGKVSMQNLSGATAKMSIGYLMRPIDASNSEWNERLTREELVLVDGEPVLVNAEGMLVQLVKNEDDETVCEYVVKDGNMLKVDNEGNIIGTIPVSGN